MAFVADVSARTVESHPLGLTAFVVLGVVLLGAASAVAALLVLPLPVSTAFFVLLAIAVVSRHLAVCRRKRSAMDLAWQRAKRGAVPDGLRLPSSYFLYVLGSGGHTAELCEMVKQQFRPNVHSHRRYVITSGDTHSENVVAKLEGLVEQTFPAGDAGAITGTGTWDVFRVVRARRVHQPLWTAWYSAGRSTLSIVQALVRRPVQRPSDAAYDVPHLIVTNGPGTGFVVSAVAHALKMLGVVAPNRCCVLYLETWAHVRTLSLTGKLFYYSGIADVFAVQHRPLADRTGARFVGEVAPYGNLLGIKKPWGLQ